MKRPHFSDEQIIGTLKEHQAGLSAVELCRKYGVSDATFYKWRSRSGGARRSLRRRRLIGCGYKFRWLRGQDLNRDLYIRGSWIYRTSAFLASRRRLFAGLAEGQGQC